VLTEFFITVFIPGSLEVCHTPMEEDSFNKVLHLLNESNKLLHNLIWKKKRDLTVIHS